MVDPLDTIRYRRANLAELAIFTPLKLLTRTHPDAKSLMACHEEALAGLAPSSAE